MACYEWQCPKCGAITERIVSFPNKENLTVHCPKCKVTMKPVEHSKPAPFKWGKGGGWN